MLTHIFVARKIEYTILKGGAYNKKKKHTTNQPKPTTKKMMGLHTTKCYMYVLVQSMLLRPKIGFTE